MDIANIEKKLQELEARRKMELNEWSKSSCIQQLQQRLNEGGLYPPPHVLPINP